MICAHQGGNADRHADDVADPFLGPDEVTVYNIAYKYMNILTMVFMIVIAPFWSAFAEADVSGDTAWMRNARNKLLRFVGYVHAESYVPDTWPVCFEHAVECPYVGAHEHEDGCAAHGECEMHERAVGELYENPYHGTQQHLRERVERRGYRRFLDGVQQGTVKSENEKRGEIGKYDYHGPQQFARKGRICVQHAAPVHKERSRHGYCPYGAHRKADYAIGRADVYFGKPVLALCYGRDDLVAHAVADSEVEEAQPCHKRRNRQPYAILIFRHIVDGKRHYDKGTDCTDAFEEEHSGYVLFGAWATRTYNFRTPRRLHWRNNKKRQKTHRPLHISRISGTISDARVLKKSTDGMNGCFSCVIFRFTRLLISSQG